MEQLKAGTLQTHAPTGKSPGYLLFLPRGYQAGQSQRWPLILFLHGAGERGANPQMIKANGLITALPAQDEFPSIVAAPQCPAGRWWTQQVDQLSALLDALEHQLAVDQSRIYLTGISMGGYGAWELALQQPERFAALAPICGGVNMIDPDHRERLARLRTLPTWIFHGVDDDVVPIAESERPYAVLQEHGADVRFTRYEGVGHDSWTPTYNNPELYRWMLAQSRVPLGPPSA